MATTLRFRDWATLDAAGRKRKRVRAVAYAEALQSRLNAFVAVGTPATPAIGVLDGMPYAAKDMFGAPDREPGCGLVSPPPISGPRYAEVLRRVDAAGGWRLGYAGMTALAYEPSGYNATHGRVKNPWDLDFISGGSSSGSAAAVASGAVVIALGSDTGGSLRIPAHACGVTAWKPTLGLVPTAGAMALAPTLDTVGLLARSAVDIEPAAIALISDAQIEARSVQSAVVLSDVMVATETSVTAACRAGVEALAGSGVTIENRDGLASIEAMDAPVFTIMQAQAARQHRALMAEATFDPALKRRLEKGLAIGDQALADGLAACGPSRVAFLDQIFGKADVVILPVLPIRTPEAATCDPTSASFDAKTLYQLSRWTRFVNLLGLPAIAVPVGFDDRAMPVAMQIVGRPHADLALIALAIALQSRTPWHGLVPRGVSDLATAMIADEIEKV
jgi:aspartyl-tRNA(Asn)/glutamyl-tRNA(Gln) amidotransferase subunit A